MSDSQFPVVIEAEALAERLDDRGTIVVDCRFDLSDPDAGFAAYNTAHIPGARYANLDEDLSRPPAPNEGRHPLPAPDALAARLGAWGVSNESYVVAYDGGPGGLASRLWWMLGWLGHARAAVLNGGFARWRRLGLRVEQAIPEPRPARFVARPRPERLAATPEDVAAFLRADGLLVDARAADRFRGENETLDPVAGHIPGAVNVPFMGNVGADGRLLPEPELRARLAGALGDHDPAAIVAMCGSGVTACHLLWAMEAAGLEPGRLYAGSWSEWIRDPARPVATGG